MDEYIYDECVNDNLKEKARRMYAKAKQKGKEAVDWCKEHPAETIAITTAVLATAKKGLRWHATFMENRRRKLDFYDPRLGIHICSKRPLTGAELAEVVRRYERGEPYATILADMKLLKKR